jgi:hypothetical protein
MLKALWCLGLKSSTGEGSFQRETCRQSLHDKIVAGVRQLLLRAITFRRVVVVLIVPIAFLNASSLNTVCSTLFRSDRAVSGGIAVM